MAQRPTILAVDDDPHIRKMLVEMLSLEGFPIETASDGAQALQVLPQLGPRVMLLDIIMPNVDGEGVMRALAADPAQRAQVQVVFMSAVDVLERYRYLGPDAILAKPFTLEQLMRVLDPIMARV